ncbi:MAG: site-specific integrase [Nitrococcus sp.]|nr:site-specific integrase [Nitrococcus sp.]
MARTVRDSRLETRTARLKLAPRGKPYYRALDQGLHIGYRKTTTGGRWVVRAYAGGGQYITQTLGDADDHADADGDLVIDFSTAQAKARQRAAELEAQARGARIGPYTVADACEDYDCEHVRPHGKGIGPRETRRLMNREIRLPLGQVMLAKITTAMIRNWLNDIAARPPCYSSGKPKPVDMTDPEVKRRRKDTANRARSLLFAVLNHAYNEGRVASDGEWRRVKAFKATSAARVRYLTLGEVRRLLNACPADFRALVRGMLLTGARPGDLKRLTVADFNPDTGSLALANRKSGRPYVCHLSNEGVKFFGECTAGRELSKLIFARADGSPWGDDDHQRPMKEANKAAKLDPPATFYCLRHTYCSHAIMAGVPMLVVAHNVGHSDTRMLEKHYGHLTEDYAKRVLREGLPTWGGDEGTNIVPMRGAK